MLTVFNKLASTLKYLWLCVCYNIKESVSNKKSFIIQTIAMFINNFVFIFFWQILFNNKGGSINGINIQDILYLWSIPTIGYGIAFFCFGGVDRLCRDIIDGNLDIYLTKPKHSLISVLTSSSILSAMGDLLFGVFIGMIAVNFNPLKILAILVLGLIAGILTTSIITSVKLLCFWLGDISNATQKYTHSLFITLTIYPERMFPQIIKVVMYTAIPAAYVAHVPVSLMKEFSISGILIMLGATVFFVTTMFTLYSKGIKNYESGNGVTRR